MKVKVRAKTLLLLPLVCGVLVSGALLGELSAKSYVLPPAEKTVELAADTSILKQQSQAVEAIANLAKKALVVVSVSKTLQGYELIDPLDFFGFGRRQLPAPKQEGMGSGFFIDLDHGYILTNNHVIEGADEISLKLANGEVYRGKVLGHDPNTDVAVVQVAEKKFNKTDLAALVLGDSDKLHVGEFVVALGAPLGLEASISTGNISALGRGSLQITQLGDFVQTDAAINPGNSGGPLVNADGKAIAMNTAIFSKSGTSSGMGFAVPSNLARRIANSLIKGEQVSRGYIGIHFQPITEEILAWLKLPKETKGVIVAQVEEKGPAGKAGLRAKDVIIAVDGKKLSNDRDLVNRIGLMKAGDKARLTYIRQGKTAEAEVEIAGFPATEALSQQGQPSNGKNPGDLGLALSFKEGGLYVHEIAPSSPAANRLSPGDLILGIDRFDIDAAQNQAQALAGFREAIKRAKAHKQKAVVLRIKRGNQGFAFITIDI